MVPDVVPEDGARRFELFFDESIEEIGVTNVVPEDLKQILRNWKGTKYPPERGHTGRTCNTFGHHFGHRILDLGFLESQPCIVYYFPTGTKKRPSAVATALGSYYWW